MGNGEVKSQKSKVKMTSNKRSMTNDQLPITNSYENSIPRSKW
ncbi:MAG: hypothetical protein N4J56_002001 [Chroococcidiopsis sp. SAG 2025]|nr:hypothetical protein [Chroococcidiopsis sp. SAG 2025]